MANNSNSRRPGAWLYNNNDGTFTGRVSSSPFTDFKLIQADDDPLCLRVTKHDCFTREQEGRAFNFKPNQAGAGMAAAMGIQDAGGNGGERLIPSEDDPTVCLRVVPTDGGIRFRLERHIQKQGGASSIAGAFGS